jgi:hypothetical protein
LIEPLGKGVRHVGQIFCSTEAVGDALAATCGETSPSSLKGAEKEMYGSMSERELEEFASSKRKGKPEHVSKARSSS